ncbi:hypothetical protein QG37_01783 [Candidozyma auris]|nr:hypothetical protein QG37_01783 [[Candida] auris]
MVNEDTSKSIGERSIEMSIWGTSGEGGRVVLKIYPPLGPWSRTGMWLRKHKGARTLTLKCML